ncbi:Katanin p80 WD40 repeat-containing subunit B1 [Polyrhizophydium stewartii]|uniref:Katanin p80 WD40 repeat-containing subunit B1 n=1 Tax=Polyrhizophydium stewartii TaxID=2732419 RepID=A0ABR4N807_9FUNG
MPLAMPVDASTPRTDSDIMDAILFRHASIENILSSRLSNLRLARDAWSETNPKASLETILAMHDNSVFVDFLRILVLKPRIVTLDMAAQLIPALCGLLFEIYEDYIQTACMMVQLLHRSFAGVIADTLQAAHLYGSGVDITFEERACLEGFGQFAGILRDMRDYPGKLGQTIRDLLSELDSH